MSIYKVPMKYLPAVFLTMFFSHVFSQDFEIESRVKSECIVMLAYKGAEWELNKQITDVKVERCLSEHMNIWLVRNTGNTPDDKFLSILALSPLVKIAQHNHRFEPRSLIPDDTHFSAQWNMLNTGQNAGLPGADIEATPAWDIDHDAVTATGDTLVIAIVDNKMDLTHPELNIFTNYNETPGNGIDDDGNGYIDDLNGWNALEQSGNVSGSDNHTIHTAGIAAAIGNNGTGVAGVCWGVKIMPVVYGLATEDNVVAAYSYVRDMRALYNTTFGTQGAFIVCSNSSFGINQAHPSGFPIWCAMYDSMGAVGILSAAATANANLDVDVEGDMPTECPSDWLIAVTATTRSDGKSTAAWGSESIDIGAPGVNIISTQSGGSYNYLTGTSMAAPHITGAVALMYSAACKGFIDKYAEQPDSMALLVKQYILESAEWLSPLNGITVSGGRLNLYRALRKLNFFNCDSCNFDASLDISPNSCFGNNDGSLSINISSGNLNDYQILWNDSSTTSRITNTAPGYYEALITDTAGCSRMLSAEIHNPDSIIINAINVIGATDSTSGNIVVNAVAGSENLIYSLDGSVYQSSPSFIVPSNGNYTVFIQNTTGCTVQENVTVSDVNDALQDSGSVSLYPNPADDALYAMLQSTQPYSGDIAVFNTIGKVVSTSKIKLNAGLSTVKVTTSHLANGVYLLKIHNVVKRFAIQH